MKLERWTWIATLFFPILCVASPPDGHPPVTMWVEWNTPETDPDDVTLTAICQSLDEWAKVTDRVIITTHPAQISVAYPKLAECLPDGMLVIGGFKGGTGTLWGTNPTKLGRPEVWIKARDVVNELLEQPGIDPSIVWLDMEGAFKTLAEQWVYWPIVERWAQKYMPRGPTYCVYPTFFTSVESTRDGQVDAILAFARGLRGSVALVENSSLWKETDLRHGQRDIDLAWVTALSVTYANRPPYRILYTEGGQAHWHYNYVPTAVSICPNDGSVLVCYPHLDFVLEGSREIVRQLLALGYDGAGDGE